MIDISALRVTSETSILEVMQAIQANGRGVALVLDAEGCLVATVTDGDLRSAVLRGVDLGLPVSEVIAYQAALPYPHPVSAAETTPKDELLRRMQELRIRHIPLLDDGGVVVDMAVLDDLLDADTLNVSAVVMAGGRGMRLRPLTDDLPKPMLPMGDRPVMEHIVEQLQVAGIRRVSVTTHYKPEVIKEHFGDGSRFGVSIDYLTEEEPLGTAGSLRLVGNEDPLLVVNGDILTHVDLRALVAYHRQHDADMTIGVRPFALEVPYGVVEADGDLVTGMNEKPRLDFFINAGIYLLEPACRSFIPKGERFDMPHLITLLVEKGMRVVRFPIHEYWLDIGEIDRYTRALDDLEGGAP